MLTFGSLFAGIGGIDLGLEWAGMTCRWQVEIDPYCQQVLAKHWPHVRRYPDAKIIPENVENVDLICGGFPCQPVSYAGQRQGQDDPRWLWPVFAAWLRRILPRYVLIENVPGLLSLGFSDVLRDLAEMGYDAEWGVLSAADVGAPHLRKRVWIVARIQSNVDDHQSRGCGLRQPKNEGETEREVNAFSVSSQAVAHTTRQQTYEQRGRPHEPSGQSGATVGSWEKAPRQTNGETGDDDSARLGKMAHPFSLYEGRHQIRWPSGIGWWEREPAEALQLAGQGGGQEDGLSVLKSQLGRVVDGLPHRVDRLKGLGNAVVPHCAEWIGRRLLATLTRPPQVV